MSDPTLAAFYRVIEDDSSALKVCEHCGHGKLWTIVHIEGDEEVALGTSWANKEAADDICDLMNHAFDEGYSTAAALDKQVVP